MYKSPPVPPVNRTFVLSSVSSSNTAGIALRICKALLGAFVPTPTLLLVESTWNVVESTVTSPLKVAAPNVVGTIASLPSKETPPIVRAVVSVPAVVAVAEFPLHAPAVVAVAEFPLHASAVVAVAEFPLHASAVVAVAEFPLHAPAVVAVAEFPLHAPAVVAEPAEPVVFWSRVGILAASSVPDVILVAFSAVSPEPLPANVVAVTVPTTSRAVVGAVVLPMEILCAE
jgi:hypothetical protein